LPDALRLQRLLLLLPLLLLTLLVPATPASAQASSEGRNITVAYTPGSRSQNGYVDAQLLITYYIRECADFVGFVARYEPSPRMLIAPHRYWVDGREVRVPSQFAAPAAEKPTLRGVIRGQNLARSIEYLWASPNPDCWINAVNLGPKSAFWAQSASAATKLAALNGIGFDQQGMLSALRNTEVEAHFRAIFARERSDSLARVASARNDSLARAQAARTAERTAQAQRDSLARTEAARRASATDQTAASEQGAEAARQREAEAERQRAANAAASRAADAEHARVTASHQREMAIQDSIRIQQLSESTAQAAMLIGAGVAKMLEVFAGTGLAIGASYSMPYLPSDGGLVGITITGYHEGIVLPYMEVGFPVGGTQGSAEYSYGVVGTVGTVIPRASFVTPFGHFQPHAGVTFLQTVDETFGYDMKTRSLLVLGLTRKSQTIMRAEVTIYGGSPRFGVALARAF